MNRLRSLIICLGCTAQAALEINNQSAHPFRITSITYEHNNGLHKTPSVELTPVIVQPHTHIQFSAMRREPILSMTAVHIKKAYEFDFPAQTKGTLYITPDNQVRLLGPQFMKNNTDSEATSNEKTPVIQRL